MSGFKMKNICKEMKKGEILNSHKKDLPLHKVTLYGDKVLCAKLSKRVSCAIKHLPIKVEFDFEYDTAKAIEKGITKDPTIFLDGNIFLEGLVSAEEITKAFESLR
jgi:hypothetical protein